LSSDTEDGFEEVLEREVRAQISETIAADRVRVTTEDHSSAGGPERAVAIEPVEAAACAVTVLAQSDAEVSFFLGPPGHPLALTVDLFDRDRDALLVRVREYVGAILTGRLEITAPADASRGRVTFVLDDGDRPRHDYNAWPWTRRREWHQHRFRPY
jgi:hypothetical protein